MRLRRREFDSLVNRLVETRTELAQLKLVVQQMKLNDYLSELRAQDARITMCEQAIRNITGISPSQTNTFIEQRLANVERSIFKIRKGDLSE